MLTPAAAIPPCTPFWPHLPAAELDESEEALCEALLDAEEAGWLLEPEEDCKVDVDVDLDVGVAGGNERDVDVDAMAQNWFAKEVADGSSDAQELVMHDS
ncbi:hypothetical protein EW146_g890 [Bondarzewia mesenterica]|uniref:Uncharacterized protein n=1 Tax=Bondarzewia mesenterica TaxID=1095465 RepID=A0A4S4M5M8_9AGAM|nr:hypothetical protein EW146_g890 [Bondarzewia mesenterica]